MNILYFKQAFISTVCADLLCEWLWLKQLVLFILSWTYWKITQLDCRGTLWGKKEGKRLKIHSVPDMIAVDSTLFDGRKAKVNLRRSHLLFSPLLSLTFSIPLFLMLLSHASCFHNTLDMHLIKPSLFLVGESLHYSRDAWRIMIDLFRWGFQRKDS